MCFYNHLQYSMQPQFGIKMADSVHRLRYVSKSLCERRGLKPTFMTRPKEDITNNGFHLNHSLWTLEGKYVLCSCWLSNSFAQNFYTKLEQRLTTFMVFIFHTVLWHNSLFWRDSEHNCFCWKMNNSELWDILKVVHLFASIWMWNTQLLLLNYHNVPSSGSNCH